MKKSLVALAALAVVGAASAQSSVTIYGRADIALSKTKGSGASLNPGGSSASWVGFRGVEDLGGGSAAFFDFQHRFSLDTGSNDANGGRPFWQGQSLVGLRGGWGEVKVGRFLTALQDPIFKSDPWGSAQWAGIGVIPVGYATQPDVLRGTGAQQVSTTSGANDGGGNGRTDQITYTTPNFGGFSGSISFGPKNTANNTTGTGATGTAGTNTTAGAGVIGGGTTGVNQGYYKSLVSTWVSYANGPIYVGGGYEQNRLDDSIAAILGTYSFGFGTVMAGFSQIKYNSLGATQAGGTSVGLAPALTTAQTGNQKRQNWNIGLIVPFGAFTAKAGYGESKLETATLGDVKDYKKLGIGLDYNLSKRTKIYSGYFNNNGKNLAGANVAPKNGYELGVQHLF